MPNMIKQYRLEMEWSLYRMNPRRLSFKLKPYSIKEGGKPEDHVEDGYRKV